MPTLSEHTKKYRFKFLMVLAVFMAAIILLSIYMLQLPQGVMLLGHNQTGRAIYGYWINEFKGGAMMLGKPNVLSCCWMLTPGPAKLIVSYQLDPLKVYPEGLQAEVLQSSINIPDQSEGFRYLHAQFLPKSQVKFSWSNSQANPFDHPNIKVQP